MNKALIIGIKNKNVYIKLSSKEYHWEAEDIVLDNTVALLTGAISEVASIINYIFRTRELINKNAVIGVFYNTYNSDACYEVNYSLEDDNFSDEDFWFHCYEDWEFEENLYRLVQILHQLLLEELNGILLK